MLALQTRRNQVPCVGLWDRSCCEGKRDSARCVWELSPLYCENHSFSVGETVSLRLTQYCVGETAVAKIIEFYIPTKFAKRVKWVPPQQRGRVIEFCLPTKKSA